MRPLEWLLFLSFLPTPLLMFIPHPWRLITVVLPTLASLLHLMVEGWRIQMIPLYLLVVVVLVIGVFTFLKYETTIRVRRGIGISVIITLMLVFGGLVAGWLLPVVKLPQPTGPYAVGIVDREVVDEARGRRLMVSVWYPAAQRDAPALLTHHPDEIMTALGNLTGLPAPVFQHLRYFKVNASEEVPVLPDNPPFPVLVFSHGMVGLRLQNSSMLQELASWGYVVVALDHTDAAAVTVFPDGEARFYNLQNFGVPSNIEPDVPLMNEYVFPVWVADQRFVYDTLETWQVNDPLLAGKLDLTRIGSFGHSFGGATALEVCRIDPRCRAAINMDGALYGETVTQPAVRPLLLMTSADSQQYTDTVEAWNHLITNATNEAYWVELPHSSHLSFTITQLLSPLLAPPTFDPRTGLRTTDKYLRLFFDHHLRGIATPLLHPTSGDTDVRWIASPP